jgi:hypothetical protein
MALTALRTPLARDLGIDYPIFSIDFDMGHRDSRGACSSGGVAGARAVAPHRAGQNRASAYRSHPTSRPVTLTHSVHRILQLSHATAYKTAQKRRSLYQFRLRSSSLAWRAVHANERSAGIVSRSSLGGARPAGSACPASPSEPTGQRCGCGGALCFCKLGHRSSPVSFSSSSRS